MRNNNNNCLKKIIIRITTLLTAHCSLFILLLIANCSLLIAWDFGFITNQYAEVDNDDFEYIGGFIPRFSMLIGDNSSLYISASFSLRYSDEFEIYPELLRTEYSTQFGDWKIKAGRIPYSEPLAFIVSGLFDGAYANYSTPIGIFGAGAFYTGLQYKRTAKIMMTPNELISYDAKLDYGDFFDTYFAPKRIIMAFDWEHPAIKELIQINASLVGQFDLQNEDDKIHSQYLIIRMGLPLPIERLSIEAGGSLQLAQLDNNDNRSFNFALAGVAAAYYMLPKEFFNSLISFSMMYSSGSVNENFMAFNPVTTVYLGDVLQARFTGISVFSLNYTARFIESLGASVNASYFIRNDTATYGSLVYGDSDGYFLGPEFSGKVTWAVFSDLQLIAGAGVFVPSLGNSIKDKDLLWKISLNVVLGIR